jgi:phage-related tail fiber protein
MCGGSAARIVVGGAPVGDLVHIGGALTGDMAGIDGGGDGGGGIAGNGGADSLIGATIPLNKSAAAG